jgi:aminoglycoside 2''-phosphotransferase
MGTERYRSIIEACFPKLQVRSIAPASEGWDSIAFEVNGDYIFRFPKRPDVEPQYVKEAQLLAELAGHVPVPIPRFVFIWPGGAAYPMRFLGHRKLVGVPLNQQDFTPLQLDQIAGQLGAFLTALHHFPIAHAVQLLAPGSTMSTIAGGPTEWRAKYQQLYRQVRDQALPLLDTRTCAAAERLWEEFLCADAHFDFRPTLIHYDLGATHILCDPATATISGVIDWGDAAIGDPAIDFVGLLDDCGTDLTERVLAAYAGDIDVTFRSRMGFYLHALPFNDILFGAATGDAELVAQGVAGVERLVRG